MQYCVSATHLYFNFVAACARKRYFAIPIPHPTGAGEREGSSNELLQLEFDQWSFINQ